MQGGGGGGEGGEFEILFLLFVWLGTEPEMYKRVGDWFPWLRAGGGGGCCKNLGIKIAPKPYTVWSLGPQALIYESLDPYGD